MTSLTGHTVGGYEVRDMIGSGGMGEVYRGMDLETGDWVAIKRLKPEYSVSTAIHLQRFVREGEVLRQLNHPNIVKMLDMVEEEGHHFIIMEYVSGGALRDQLRREPQQHVDRVLNIGLDLCDALTRAHRLNIIHRDLKPANVLLAKDGTPRLTDFGTAHFMGDLHVTRAGSVVGTPYYISPEAFSGKEADSRTDIWALGVLLFEMLAGRRPFDGDTISSLALAIAQQPTPDLEAVRPDIPVALVDLIYRMLEKEPDARIPSVRLIGAEIEGIMSGTLIVNARPVPPLDFSSTSPTGSSFDQPTPPPVDVPRHNLPAQTTMFVGRLRELAQLDDLFADRSVRLVTLLGPGGMGKTRLALEVASRQLNNFRDGVYFVSLAPLRNVSTLVATVAEAVGFEFLGGSDPAQQLWAYLAGKRMLLIMDNFEHILEGASVVTDLLEAAPGARVLATSRERLNLQEETIVHIGGLDLPTRVDDTEASSIRLFVQSARRAQPGFDPQSDDLAVIAQICRQVGALPLGIVLAAAWLEMLSLQEISEEIERSPDFLETDMRNIPDRHRSIRAIFESSWARLSAAEQSIFLQLTVFRGTFTREAAQQISGAGLRTLMGLVNKSLLFRDPNGRYMVHEMLRQFAAEKFAETPDEREAARQRHAAYYAEFVAAREAQLRGGREEGTLAEVENLRMMWTWVVKQHAIDLIARAMRGLFWFYNGRAWFEEGLNAFRFAADTLADDNTGRQGVLRGQMLTLAGWFPLLRLSSEPHAQGVELVQEGLALLDDLGAEAERAFPAAFFASAGPSPSLEDAIAALEAARATLATHKDAWGIAWCERALGGLTTRQGDLVASQQHYEASLQRYASLHDRWGIAWCEHDLGQLARRQGNFPAAQTHLESSLANFRAIENRRGEALALTRLSSVALALGDVDMGIHLGHDALAIRRALGHRDDRLRETVTACGDAAYLARDFNTAQQCYQEALSLARDLGLGICTIQACQGLALTAVGLENPPAARDYLRTAYEGLDECDAEEDALPNILYTHALLLTLEHQPAQATEILAGTLTHLRGWQRGDATELERGLRAMVPSAEFEAIWAQGAARTLAECALWARELLS